MRLMPSQRLNMLNKYLVEAKHKLEGDDHIEFVIKTLEGLLHHQPQRSHTTAPAKTMGAAPRGPAIQPAPPRR